MSSKYCGGCSGDLDLSEFYSDRSRLDGLSTRCKACKKSDARKWQLKNPDPEGALARGRRYEARHRGRSTLQRRANPDKWRQYDANRRARELGAFVEHVDRLAVWDRDEGVCHICHLVADPTNWHLDHVRALANGGEHSYANTAVSHPSCNQAKGAKPWPIGAPLYV